MKIEPARVYSVEHPDIAKGILDISDPEVIHIHLEFGAAQISAFAHEKATIKFLSRALVDLLENWPKEK